MVRLQNPSRDLSDSYRGLIAEIQAAGENPVPFPLSYPYDDFDAMLVRLDNDARSIDLPKNFVPSSTYWLVSDAGEIVGVSNLRHRLSPVLLRHGGNIGYGIRPSARRKGFGKAILGQTLARAKELGLPRVLVTCSKQNLGSSKIIVANDGVLESEDFIPERGEVVQRFWIEIRA